MKFIKKNWYYIVVFILVFILSALFSPLKSDWYWSSVAPFKGFNSFLNISYGKLLGSIISILLTKYKLLKVITYSIITISLFVLIKNIINKKNNNLLYVGICLFFLLDNMLINSTYVSLNGFINEFLGTLFVLILINFILKKTINKLNILLIFIFGLVSTLISYNVTTLILILVVTLFINKYREKDNFKHLLSLLFGTITGFLIMFISSSYREVYSFNITYNLFHELIPKIFNMNFFIILILISLLLFLSIKIFVKGTFKNKVYVTLSITSITVFSLAYLLSTNYILNYISYVLFTVSTLYILLHANNSKIFKDRIKIYYTVKILYLIIILCNSTINTSNLLLPFILDIMVILELINYVLPNDFLKGIWISFSILLLLSNTYIYSNVYKKNTEMNWYIKIHLECSMYDVSLPSKYETVYLIDYIPENESEIKNYIEYYDIDIDSCKDVKIYFNR